MDQRAQISVEFILLTAIVLVVVIAFAAVISDQTEIDSVATAVRTGAENSTTQLSLLNRTMQPVRVTSINMTGTDNINIQVHFSGNVSSVQSQILSSINNALTAQHYNTGYSGGTQINLQTNKHNYTIIVIS